MVKILLVDDQPQSIELLEAHLVPQGYEIVKAANGEEALEKLAGNPIDLILLDVMMPGMDGFEVTRRVRQDEKNRLLPIILVTSLRETEDRVRGIEAGCDDFLSKPIDNRELLARVRSLLKVKAYNDLLSNYRKELESEVTKRTEKLKQSNTVLYKIMQDTIQAMAVTCEMRDPYTAGHQQKVAQLAVTIAEELHLSDKDKMGLRAAAFLHDIGKISIPAEILSRPGKLTTMEFDLVKKHVQASYYILKGIDFPWPVAQIVYQHHERMDGSGYPNALSGKDIKLEARILAVADVIEAMTSHRPYRPALGIDKALEEISRNRGKLYDADVVDVCSRVINNGFKFDEVITK